MIELIQKWYHLFLSIMLGRPCRRLAPLYSLIEIVNQSDSSEQFNKTFYEKLTIALKAASGRLPVNYIIFHKGVNTKKRWISNSNHANLSHGIDLLLNSALENDQISKISSDSLLLSKLNRETEQRDYKYGVAFIIQNQYKFLILTTYLNDDTIKLYDLLYNIISQILVKQNLLRRVDELDKKTNLLEFELTQNQNNLRQTERSLKKRVYEINNLLELSSELYSILDLKQLVNSALLTIAGQIGFQKSIAMIYEPSKNSYSNITVKGIKKDNMADMEIEVDHPIVRFLLDRQQPVSLKEIQKDEKLKDVADNFKQFGLELIAPIIHSDRLKGLIGCGEKLYGQKLDESDMQVFTILINILSISLSNAQTYEEVKLMSFTDGMTGLNNYRYFENRLREEMNRAKRNGSKLSLIMLDIDFFKNYNDTLGHQAGDEALRALAWVLKDTARDDDIVNRYGGEEFSIILPGMEKERINILAERIRAKVAEHPFYKEHVQPDGKLTISVGAATYPDDAGTFDELVSKADKALYKAKDDGRNKFILYQSDWEK